MEITAQDKKQNQKKAIGVILMLFIGKFSCFIRDVMISAIFGMNGISDAFLISFRIPNFFKYFIAEGSLNLAFVPTFSKKLMHSDDEANKYATSVFFTMLIILTTITLLVEFFTEKCIFVFSSIGDDFQHFHILCEWMRVNFIYVFFVGIASLLNCILCARNCFAFSFIGQIILNFGMISSMIFLSDSLIKLGYSLSYVIFGSGIIYFLIVAVAANFHKFKLLKITIRDISLADSIHFLKNIFYAILWIGVSQINSFIDLFFAGSLATGSISCIYYADKASRFPMSLISIPLSMLFLPMLSKALEKSKILNNKSSEEIQEIEAIKHNVVEKAIFFSLPIMIALLSMTYPIVEGIFSILPNVFFGKSNFDSRSLEAIANTMFIFSLSLPAIVLFKVISMICFSYEKQSFLLYSGLLSIGMNVILNYFLVDEFGSVGIAISTVSASWIGLSALILLVVRHRILNSLDMMKICFRCSVSGIFSWIFLSIMKSYFFFTHDLQSIIMYFILILLSFAVFALMDWTIDKILAFMLKKSEKS